ncbi:MULTISPECIES: ABC transporter permease [Crocosphaera]|uniref:Oligopeptide transport system permease protein oppB n=3 Tax=Crocosphaera watsonii TaxID=263511 RepID=T2JMX0_CROWT|nr:MULTISPECIES: ABC transporter permease [Crocosphaera]EHJ12909.1 Binding-protein-dependent transport systems inner membrane component [Crocosphaera watsonii WH 0003]MCH2247737.1 ABC transporter permease [Crocosphaera sp.]NQZ61949.1 ABC transporter permease [Crocosphaera sp.]CCQ57155.1 Oligopeptide transport system permease protein OppB (TC 3.A.1.5.1) [Crocosphaera watsonii WH 0005]CCQ65877.1 Oligopeptide transport system permease protein oppB [Crocosphaera watsonii WH 0402]
MTQTLSPEPNKPSNKLENWLDAESIVYVVKRILQGLLTILLASILSFIIIQLAPGDYLDTLKQNPKIAEETIKQLTNQFGLDKPWYVQYWRWFVQVVTQLDFGTSFVYNRSVASLLGERIPATLLLAISSIIITWLIAIPLGILSAVKQSSWTDKILRVVSYLGQGFPSFITALVLLIIAQYLSPLLPVGNMTSLNHTELSPIGKILDIAWHMILPTIALSITSFAGLMRLMRGQMLDVMRQDYIQTARAKGLPEDKVIYVHGLRNAINPLITLLGFEFASLLGGSFIAEFFFNWPGLGRLILQAVTAQDLYLVMGSLTMGATMLIVGNLLADLLLKAVDPRIKLENIK